MEVNISRTARPADAGSLAPAGAAPITVALDESLTGDCLVQLNWQSEFYCRSRPGQPPQFVQSRNDHLLRHIVHNLDFANRPRQNEMYGTVARLLITQQQAHDVPAASLDRGQLAKTKYRIGDSYCSVVIDALGHGRDMRGRDHPPCHRLAVQKTPVARFGLKRMPNGV